MHLVNCVEFKVEVLALNVDLWLTCVILGTQPL